MEKTKILIAPGHTDKNYVLDLWRYRELFYILSWRDISTRYKQTVVGVLWALIKPFLTMIVFTIIFGKLAKLPTEGTAPYTLMVFAAMLPWQFFSSALTEASGSLIGNAQLITKVYFPRLIIPISSVITCVVDFLISICILVGLMLYYHFMPPAKIVLLPLWLLMAFLAALGPGLYLTALNVKYRDFRYIVPFLVQFGLYISPVGFSSAIIPEKYRLLYCLNPMVAVIDGFRWSILGQNAPIYWPGFYISAAVILLSLYLGIKKFRSMEKNFADII